MSSISFDNAWLLFIALPLLALFAVPFIIAVRRDNVSGHNIASLCIHVVLAAIIAFAAAGTHIVTVMTETDVLVVADVSYSANRNLDTVDGYIKNIKMPKNSKMGVIAFGKDYKLVSDFGKNFKSVKNSGVNGSETNISSALEYASTLFGDNVIKRIVLITDGRETYNEDSNKLKRTVDGLAARNITVDAVYLNDNLSPDAKEVQISNAQYTSSAQLNHDEYVNVYVQSSYATTATLTLYKNGMAVSGGSKTVNLSVGLNNVSFKLDTFEEGTYDYRVTVYADGDESGYNNTYSFTQSVAEVTDVLLISSRVSDYAFVQSLYPGEVAIDSYINNVNVPVSVEDLAKYDQIILSDVEITSLNNYELFLDSLDAVVSKFGKSLLTFGDLGIQSSDEGAKMDDMLPIRYGKSVAPKLYNIAIDVSHSMMAGHDRFRLAKLAAIQLINFIKDDDYVRLSTFSGNSKTLMYGRVGPNRDKMISEIKELTTEQGTYVGLGLYDIMQSIVNAEFSEKQIMLITDGIPFDGIINYGGSEYAGLTDKQAANSIVTTMRSYGIVTSVLHVGGSTDAAETGGLADVEFLTRLAYSGGGTYHNPKNEIELGSVVFDEIKEADKPEIGDTWITVERPRDLTLTGVNTELAYVSDYALGKAKSAATEVMMLKYRSGKTSADVSLYAYWNYGNGKAASYSGKLNQIKKNNGENVNGTFFGNVISQMMPAEKASYPYTVKTEINGKTVAISMTPAELHAKASASVKVKRPSGEEYEQKLVFDSVNYSFKIAAEQIGKYDVRLTYTYNGMDYVADASFNISYEPEYDAFAVCDVATLYKAIGTNGSVSEDGNLTIENDASRVATYTVELTVPLLIIAVVLYVADIAIRKLKWKDIVSLFKKVKPSEEGGNK